MMEEKEKCFSSRSEAKHSERASTVPPDGYRGGQASICAHLYLQFRWEEKVIQGIK